MRIIAGSKKGIVLNTIHGNWIRPTSDKIRGAVFSSLLSEFYQINGFVDCFAGSGAMAIEAASRGIENIYCFDNNKKSIQIIKKNIKLTNFEKEIKVYPISIQKGLGLLEKNQIKVDVFFMDPPYKKIKQIYSLLEEIYNRKLLSTNGLIVIEHDKSDIIQLEKNYHLIKERKYGNTVITFIKENEESSLSGIV